MPPKIVKWDEQDIIPLARKCLAQQGVLIYPTDSSYGIGCDARVGSAIDYVRDLKEREKSVQPFSVCVTKEQLPVYAKLTHYASNLVEQLFPGTYTLVLPQKGLLTRELNPTDPDRIGFRVPNLQPLLEFLGKLEMSASEGLADIP